MHKALEQSNPCGRGGGEDPGVIDAIVLTPEDGKLRVNLTVVLAGILSLTQKEGPARRTRPMHRK